MSKKPKLLLLSNTFPYPPDIGGAARFCFYFIEFLSERYDITFVCFVNSEDKKFLDIVSQSCCRSMFIYSPGRSKLSDMASLLSLEPSIVSRWRDSEMRHKVSNLLRNESFDVIFASGLGMAQFVKDSPIKTIAAPIDALSLLFNRRAAITQNLVDKLTFTWESFRLKRYERTVLNRFDSCYVVSESDQRYYEKLGLTKIFSSTLGVDSEYFRPIDTTHEPILIFTGVMDYPPNVDAVIFMCREVMPILEESFESIKFYIVGRNPTDAVKNLSSEKVIVTGFVDDLREYISKASVYVCPLRYGTGIKCKILEASAMAKPIVATSISLEGLSQLEAAVIKADTAIEIALGIETLLNDQTLAHKMGKLGRKLVEQSYGWDATYKVIGSKIDALIAN